MRIITALQLGLSFIKNTKLLLILSTQQMDCCSSFVELHSQKYHLKSRQKLLFILLLLKNFISKHLCILLRLLLVPLVTGKNSFKGTKINLEFDVVQM